MAMVIKRFEVFLVNLDLTVGSEIQKTRPCLIISPNEINDNINTIIIAPLTSKRQNYPTRVVCKFDNKTGQIVLDQIRTIDKSRLVKHLGQIDSSTQQEVLRVLSEMFAP